MKHSLITLSAVLATGFASAAQAGSLGNSIWLSTLDAFDTELGGTQFRDGDVIRYNQSTDTGTIAFNEDLFGGTNTDITAFHILPNGNFLLSVLFNGRTLGGLTFDDGDLVEYNPFTDTAVFSSITESTFDDGDSDISAVSQRSDGNLVFSTFTDESIGGSAFTDGDIVLYDVLGGTASVLVAESLIFDDGDGDIDAIHALNDGRYLLSAATDEVISGASFLDGDVVLYDPASDSASLYFGETEIADTSEFQNLSRDVNAVYVPGTGPVSLLAISGLFGLRRRRAA